MIDNYSVIKYNKGIQMVDFVVDVELSLTMKELEALKKLADKQGKDIAQVARDCMNSKCKELLHEDLFTRVEQKITGMEDKSQIKQFAEHIRKEVEQSKSPTTCEPCKHQEPVEVTVEIVKPD